MSIADLKVANKLWLISDTHFGHRNIIKFQQRPESHEIMLSEWIKAVGPDDQILHLGDVWMKASTWRWVAIISNLPGRKYLILGNHDKDKLQAYEDAGFTIVDPFIHRGVAFSHRPVTNEYPLWAGEGGRLQGVGRAQSLMRGAGIEPPAGRGWHTNIHGHIHGNVLGAIAEHDGSPLPAKKYVNVSVEATGLKPVRLGTVSPL